MKCNITPSLTTQIEKYFVGLFIELFNVRLWCYQRVWYYYWWAGQSGKLMCVIILISVTATAYLHLHHHLHHHLHSAPTPARSILSTLGVHFIKADRGTGGCSCGCDLTGVLWLGLVKCVIFSQLVTSIHQAHSRRNDMRAISSVVFLVELCGAGTGTDEGSSTQHSPHQPQSASPLTATGLSSPQRMQLKILTSRRHHQRRVGIWNCHKLNRTIITIITIITKLEEQIEC